MGNLPDMNRDLLILRDFRTWQDGNAGNIALRRACNEEQLDRPRKRLEDQGERNAKYVLNASPAENFTSLGWPNGLGCHTLGRTSNMASV